MSSRNDRIIVVGAGPVGLTAALALGRRGAVRRPLAAAVPTRATGSATMPAARSVRGAAALAFRYAIKNAHAAVARGVLGRITQRLAAMPVPVPPNGNAERTADA